MLTVMCPNCRHRFPAPCCCGSDASPACSSATGTSSSSSSATLVSFEQQQQPTPIVPRLPASVGHSSGGSLLVDDPAAVPLQPLVTISTQCGIQSGGCLIQSSNTEMLLHHGNASRLELRSKMSGGGCLVQKTIEPDYYHQDIALVGNATKETAPCRPLLISEEQLRRSFEQAAEFHRSHSTTARLDPPPSGYQELPGTRRELPTCTTSSSAARQQPARASESRDHRCCCYHRCCYAYCGNASRADSPLKSCCGVDGKDCSGYRSHDEGVADAAKCSSGDVRIQVNATVHLPCTSSATVSSCTLNITACASGLSSSTLDSESSSRSNGSGIEVGHLPNNFNGGGIVDSDNDNASGGATSSAGSNVILVGNNNVGNSRDDAPGTPISWLTPCPWTFDADYLPEKDMARLTEVRRTLQGCGWYHEGLSWQQSENLLKDAPVGRWLMRDSSDSRYTFAISVQTARGPTSVRVFYFMGKFRLDAEPRLAFAMPLFDCPIKMLEYYCEYSKRMDEHRQEVWVDYSGQIYSQIYLSEPLVKEVRSLSHIARIAVNKAGSIIAKEREKLPLLIKNYLEEYPYTL